jgi:hypothetical protein
MRNIYGLPIRKAGEVNPLAGKFLLEHEDLLPNESKIADIIGTALEELRAGAFGQSMMNALSANNAATAVANLDWGKFGQTLSTMRLPLEQQLAASGKGEAKALGDVIGHMAFNVTDPRAIEYAASRAGEMVVTFSQAVKDDVRGVITSAFVNQTNPREIAGMIDRQVGLFPRWANAVENRYQSSLTSFVAGGMPIADAQDRAQTLADAYRERLIDKRCQMIARTEVIRAANEGRATAWAQAVDAGLIDPTTTTKEWIAEADACDECEGYDAEQVWLDDVFSSGDDMPPAHPNCRCTAVLVPDGEPTERPENTTPATDTLPAMSVEDITPPAESETTSEEPVTSAVFDDPAAAIDAVGVDTLSDWMAAKSSGSFEQATDSLLWNHLGYDALPQIVSPERFDELVQAGQTVNYRGVEEATHVDQFKTSDLFPGTGVYGNGSYTTDVRSTALEYARGSESNVMPMIFSQDIKSITYEAMEAHVNEAFRHVADMMDAAAARGDWDAHGRLKDVINLVSNPGRLAGLMGYDAITVPFPRDNEIYTVLLNRGMAVMSA